MADFLVVHGGSHGAWCWERLIAALETLGHRGHALDLPAHGTAGGEPAGGSRRCPSERPGRQP